LSAIVIGPSHGLRAHANQYRHLPTERLQPKSSGNDNRINVCRVTRNGFALVSEIPAAHEPLDTTTPAGAAAFFAVLYSMLLFCLIFVWVFLGLAGSHRRLVRRPAGSTARTLRSQLSVLFRLPAGSCGRCRSCRNYGSWVPGGFRFGHCGRFIHVVTTEVLALAREVDHVQAHDPYL
jgi:hypothetical protein